VRTATGSVRADSVLFAVLVLVLVVSAPWLRVYHSITVVRVEAREIGPGGVARPLPLPAGFRRLGYLGDRPGFLETLAPQFARHTAEQRRAGNVSEGAAVEWTVRWSRDSMRLDQARTFVFEGAARGAR
jgi:hypothetical protein